MAVYIALCDDNIADRKHLERLLGREHDKRNAEGIPLYIDSFGSKEALLRTPNRYDLFLLDLTHAKGADGLSAAREIRLLGIDAEIVLICSTVNYRERAGSEDDFLFRDQPITQNDISELISLAIARARKKTEQS